MSTTPRYVLAALRARALMFVFRALARLQSIFPHAISIEVTIAP